MRKLTVGIILLVAAAASASAQMGKQIVVQVGSPQDRAVTAIQATADLHQKLALLNKFAAAYPSGDMSLMADNLYVSVYSSLKNYAQAYSYGDKALALDPSDLNVAVELIRDAQLQSNTAKMVSYALRVGQMIARFESQPAPAGTSAAQWAQQEQQTLASIQPQINWVISATNYAISTVQSANTKAAMSAEMAKAFPKAQ